MTDGPSDQHLRLASAVSKLSDALCNYGEVLSEVRIASKSPKPDLVVNTTAGAVRVVHVRDDDQQPWADYLADRARQWATTVPGA